MNLLWTQAQQQAIKKISLNRIDKSFDKLAEETQITDLQPLLGFDMFQDLVQNPTTEWNAKLLAGGTYTYNSVTYIYSGLIYTLAYFLYARYVSESNEFDTYVGMVQKDNQDSRHLEIGAIKNRVNSIRQIANKHWEDCERFINANIAVFPYALNSPNNICCLEKRKIIYL